MILFKIFCCLFFFFPLNFLFLPALSPALALLRFEQTPPSPISSPLPSGVRARAGTHRHPSFYGAAVEGLSARRRTPTEYWVYHDESANGANEIVGEDGR